MGVAIGTTLSVGRAFMMGKDFIVYWGRALNLGYEGVSVALVGVLLFDFFVFTRLMKFRKGPD